VQLIRDAGQGPKVKETTSKVRRFEMKASITAATPTLVTLVIEELEEH